MPALSQITFKEMHERALKKVSSTKEKIMLFFTKGEGCTILVVSDGDINNRGIFRYKLSEISNLAELNLKLQEHGFFVISEKDEFEALKIYAYHQWEEYKEIEGRR